MWEELMRTKTSILIVATALVIGTATAYAAVGPLIQVSTASPFGPLENCGNVPGTVGGPGIAFIDSEVEPWVDVNPADPDNIVAFWQQDRWSNGGSRGNVAGVSFDGGATWAIVPVPGITDCTGGPWDRSSDPWVSFAPDGTLHQMSLVFDVDPPADRPGGFGPNGMAVSRSQDGGLTWSDPILLVETDDPGILHDKNSITADPTDADYVYAVWDRLSVSKGDVINPELVPGNLAFKGPALFARSTDGGDTWEEPVRVYDPGAISQTIGNQVVVVLPNGAVIDFFNERLGVRGDAGPGAMNLSFKYSPDKGETWLPRGRPIRTNKIFSIGAVTPDDEIPVRDGSGLFDVAAGGDGSIYAVWQDVRFDGVEAVAFSMSTDGGFTWSAPIKVNQTPASANPLRAQAFLPSVDVNGDGVVGVSYYDFRNDDTSGELADHWFVSCDGSCADPSGWGGEQRLTDASFDYVQAPFAGGLFLGDYVGLTSDGSDFLAFFQQSSAADPADGFFRRVDP
jgi:hypothetical protein